MSTPIPPPLRAVAGLAAVAIDSARKLPEQLVGLPVLAVSAALQVSLKAQQRYAALVARGDEVLGQLREPDEAPPWARFDDEPVPSGAARTSGATRPRSAFDAVPEPADSALLDELAADQLGGGEPEAGLLADAEAGLDGTPVLQPDGVTATEAEVGGLDVAEVPLAEVPLAEVPLAEVPLEGTAPGVNLPAGAVTGRAPGAGTGLAADREPGSATEPGVDLAAGTAGDAAEAGAAIAAAAAGREPGSVTEPGVDLPDGGPGGLAGDAAAVEDALADPLAGAGTGGGPADPAAGLDGYLAVDPPIPHYDELSIPQLRGRLRSLSEAQLAELVGYERATAARPPYLTMLENRLATVRSR